MKILVQTHCPVEECDINGLMVIPITHETASRIGRRLELLKRLSEQDDGVYQLSFWDYSPDLVNYDPELDKFLKRKQARALDMDNMIAVEDVKIKDDRLEKLDYSRMILSKSGPGIDIIWEAYVKHTELCFTSERVSLEWIRSVLGPEHVDLMDILDGLAEHIMEKTA